MILRRVKNTPALNNPSHQKLLCQDSRRLLTPTGSQYYLREEAGRARGLNDQETHTKSVTEQKQSLHHPLLSIRNSWCHGIICQIRVTQTFPESLSSWSACKGLRLPLPAHYNSVPVWLWQIFPILEICSPNDSKNLIYKQDYGNVTRFLPFVPSPRM